MGYIEENKEIIKELLDSGKIKAGQLINYAHFLEIYELYRDRISEQDFAEILGMKYYSYMGIKCKKDRNTKVLENEESISEDEKELIIQELLKEKKVIYGQSIDYEYFKEIYEPYSTKISEKDFAEILEINITSYRNIKNRRIKNKNINRKKRIDK